jgi:Rod binding domain-containing protein
MSSILPASIATVSPGLATAAATPGRGAKAAREFETSLIGSLLESLEKTFATLPGENPIPGADDYNYLGSQALAQGLAARGGFGIAAMITRDLAAHEGKGETTSSDTESVPKRT